MGDLSRRDVFGGAGVSLAVMAVSGLVSDVEAAGVSSAKFGDLGNLWVSFCEELAKAAAVLRRPQAPRTELDQVEGIRYLSRLTRTALEMALESSDPDFPRFFQLSNETIKIGADNPDNIYHNAVISGDRTYRITGHRGNVPYLSFGTKANRYAIDGTMASTGELDAKDMVISSDGSFEIVVSRERNGAPNWLPLQSDSTMLLVRQTFLDKSAETPASLRIEAVGGPAVPAPLTQEKLTQALRTVTAFVAGTANTFAKWSEMFMERPNELLPWDQSFFQKAGGDPSIYYLHGYWALKPGQAWVIKTRVPDCRFWNFQLDNWWMESLDYRTRPNVWINPKKAKLDADGTLTLVVADRDLGFGNWIDTAGHDNGTALLRWIGASEHPLPTTEIITL